MKLRSETHADVRPEGHCEWRAKVGGMPRIRSNSDQLCVGTGEAASDWPGETRLVRSIGQRESTAIHSQGREEDAGQRRASIGAMARTSQITL